MLSKSIKHLDYFSLRPVPKRISKRNNFLSFQELIDRGKLQPIEKEKEDEEEGDTEKPSEAEMTVHCVTCGQDLHTKTAIRHMERCYNKFESQTSFASKFKTQIENHSKHEIKLYKY